MTDAHEPPRDGSIADEPGTSGSAGEEPAASYQSVAGSVARGGAWSLVGQAATFTTALVATPFTIRLLGPARYGLWALLQSGLTWVGLADFGMSSASTRFGGDSLARHDDDGEVRAIWTAAAVTISTTTLAAAGSAVAAPLIVKHFFHLHGDLASAGSLALRMLCIVAVLQAVVGTLNTPQIVRLKWRSFTLVTSGSAVLQVAAVPIALATTNGGLVTLAAVVIAVTALAAAATIWIAVRLQPKMRHPHVDRRFVRTLFKYGGALTISGLATIPLTTAERLLLGHFATTSVVAYYAVASRLGALISVIPAAVALPLFPALIALQGARDSGASNALFNSALRGAFLVLTPVTVLLAFVAQPFLAVWAGQIYGRHSADPFYVVLVGVWFGSMAWNAESYLAALDRPGILARVRMLEVIPYVAVAALLTATLGAMGAAIAWSSRALIDAVVLFWYSRKIGHASLSPFSQRRFMSAGAPLGLGALLFVLATQTDSLLARLILAAAVAVGYGALTWRVTLTSGERSTLRALAAQAAPRFAIGVPRLK